MVVQVKEHDKWVTIGEGYDGRNYKVFTALAGVRCCEGIVPICEPRGLPDCPDTAYFDEGIKIDGNFIELISSHRSGSIEEKGYWLGDHSYSWLLLSEVLAYDWTSGDRTWKWENFLLWLSGYAQMARYVGGPASIRFIFGFDS